MRARPPQLPNSRSTVFLRDRITGLCLAPRFLYFRVALIFVDGSSSPPSPSPKSCGRVWKVGGGCDLRAQARGRRVGGRAVARRRAQRVQGIGADLRKVAAVIIGAFNQFVVASRTTLGTSELPVDLFVVDSMGQHLRLYFSLLLDLVLLRDACVGEVWGGKQHAQRNGILSLTAVS